jgi:hypothetical protein
MSWLMRAAWLGSLLLGGCDCGEPGPGDAGTAEDGGTSADDGGTPADDGGTSADDGGTSADDGGTSTNDGGTSADAGAPDGGEDGGVGGDASTQDAGPIVCADSAMTIPNTGTGPWLANGTVSSDDFEGSCSAGYPGEDALLVWVAPAAGTYLFSTQGTGFDTILHVHSSCASPPSEVGCNDQIGLSNQAEVELVLADQQRVHIVVDSYRDTANKDFVLRIWEAGSLSTPDVSTLDAYCNLDPNALGLELSGSAPFDDLGTLALELLDDSGTPILLMNGQAELELGVSGSSYVDASISSESYDLSLSALMATPLADVASVRVRVANLAGHYGPTMTAACASPPELVAGAVCDPNSALDRCPAGQRCSTEAGPATCVDATAPTLVEVGAAYNYQRRSLGVSATGADLEHNAWYARVDLLDSELEPLRIDPSDPLSPLFDPVYIELFLSWSGDDYVGRGSTVLPTSIPPAAAFEAVRITVVDRTGLGSDALDTTMRAPLNLLSGDPCDFVEAFGVCPSSEVCGYDDGNVGSPTFCQVPVSGCPDDWPVVELDALAAGADTWLHTGSSSATTVYGGEASRWWRASRRPRPVSTSSSSARPTPTRCSSRAATARSRSPPTSSPVTTTSTRRTVSFKPRTV